MKKRASFWFLPILILGAILWGVNWRLDNPPLSKTDLKFRAAVAGADELRVYSSLGATEVGRLQGKDVADLVDGTHLNQEVGGPSQTYDVFLLRFFKNRTLVATFTLDDGPNLYSPYPALCNLDCALTKRSALRLMQTFDALDRKRKLAQ